MWNAGKIKVVVFDADDTLWDCQSHFESVEKYLYGLIAPYCDDPKQELLDTERGNMEDLGFGCKAFTISVMETALRIADNHLGAGDMRALLSRCKQLLHIPADPLPGVADALQTLTDSGAFRLALFTKGELQDQENKLRRSGLAGYFSHVEIVSNKDAAAFRTLCDTLSVSPDELVMVGNSLKSDIVPALSIGAWAVHIPFHVTWQLEHADEIEHDRMLKIERMEQLPPLLLPTSPD